MARPNRPIPPLDTASLDRLALRYVERFQTTRGKLADYLRRKVRERGWDGPPADPVAVAERLAALGYVDDRAWAEAKAAALGRRGLGARRVTGALREGRVADSEHDHVGPAVAAAAEDAAMLFARRRRIGPYASEPAEREMRERQLGAMLRAGHPLELSRRIVRMAPGETLDDN